jgi:hypothetical protein
MGIGLKCYWPNKKLCKDPCAKLETLKGYSASSTANREYVKAAWCTCGLGNSHQASAALLANPIVQDNLWYQYTVN